MSGLKEQKKYNWKETNLEFFGSDLEKKIKKASAECEDAWKGAGEKEGLQIWRIVQFKVTHWPRKDYGKFYTGDSYIILNTYRKNPSSPALSWDLHFWIGKYSSQDEYGTAAYKTVELDHYLDDKPIQHREVQGHESKLFRSYFSERIVLLKGGAETGFHHVEEHKYEPRLLHFKGKKDRMMVEEVKLRRKYLNEGDVFILDLGLHIIQWNGTESNKDERTKAAAFMQATKSDRGGRPQLETIEGDVVDESHVFYKMLPSGFFGSNKPKAADKGGNDEGVKVFEKKLFRIHEYSVGHRVTFKQVAKGKISHGLLDPSDVFVLDTGFHVYVWVGNDASTLEKGRALILAQEYLRDSHHPFLPITRITQKQHCLEFDSSFDDRAEIGSQSSGTASCIAM